MRASLDWTRTNSSSGTLRAERQREKSIGISCGCCCTGPCSDRLQSKIREGSHLVITKSTVKPELNDMSVQRAVEEGTMSLEQVEGGLWQGALLKADAVLRLIDLLGMVNRVRQGLLCRAQPAVSHKESRIKKRGERMKLETQGNKENMRSSGKEEAQLKWQGEFFSQACEERNWLTSARIIHDDNNHWWGGSRTCL